MTGASVRTVAEVRGAPEAESEQKPANVRDLTAASWRYAVASTIREFSEDNSGDMAAGLTYRTVFALFPGLLALVSMLGILGHSEVMTDLLAEAEKVLPEATWDSLHPVLETVLNVPAPGVGLGIGLLVALWSASSYIKAFGRAMNIIYDVREGRGAVRLNLQMYLTTVVMLVLIALALVIVSISGPLAQIVGGFLGLGATTITVWNITKWLVFALVVVLLVALLYYATPNVRQPRLKWITPGASLAIAVSAAATLGFFFYVSNFGRFNETYGALAGVIVLLLWLYILNMILLFGATFDCQIERARELQAGIDAEYAAQLPARDVAAAVKRERKNAEAIKQAQALRDSRGTSLVLAVREDLLHDSTADRESNDHLEDPVE